MNNAQEGYLLHVAAAQNTVQNSSADDVRKNQSAKKLSYEATREAMDLFDRPEGPAYVD